MRSRIEGRNYLIQYSEGEIPVKISRARTDKALLKLCNALDVINKELNDLYETSSDLYYLISDSFKNHGLDTDEGECIKLVRLKEKLSDLKDDLSTRSDDIFPYEIIVTLSDLGYKNVYRSDVNWQRTIQDDGHIEIFEEILLIDDPLRRLCTIEWEKVENGRRSKSIIKCTL